MPETNVIERAGLLEAVEQAGDGIVITDTTGKIQYVNPAFTALTGYTREDILGQNPRLLRSDHNPPRIYDELWTTIQSGKIWVGELINRRKDGTLYHEEMRIAPVHDQNGGVTSFIAIKHDVTQRLAAAEAQRLLAAIVESSGDAIVACTTAGTIVTWNRGAEELFGYTSTDAIGKNLRMLAPPELPDSAPFLFEPCNILSQESVCLRRDGERIQILVSRSLIQRSDSSAAAISLIIRDITERKKTEERLRESEQLLRTLVDGLKDCAILMLDAEGRVVSWSASAERVQGYPAAEIIGRSFACFYTPEDIESGHADDVLRIATKEGYLEEEGWRVRRDGSRFFANVTISALRDRKGHLCGFSKMTRDITELKVNRERIQESEQQFRAMLESSPDGVVIIDDDGMIVLVNSQTEMLFGYSRQEIIGQPVEVLLVPVKRPEHIQHRSTYAKTAVPRPMSTSRSIRGVRKDGSDFPVEVSLSHIQTPGKSWVAAAVRDATERERVECELVTQKQRAEDANRTKSAFLAAMSHEIRTPMNAILGMSDMLWESDLNVEQRGYVEIFRRAGTNLLGLLDNILDLAKIESGRFEMERQPFKVQDILHQVLETFAGKARNKGIALLMAIAPDVPADLIGDPGKLRQVLFNLVGNAVKFTDSGEIAVAVHSESEEGLCELRFSVSDTGSGIPEDKLSVIFDDFIQADSSVTRRYGGTGLGLGISRRIVERMGGTLTVTSEMAKGSTFQFTAFFERGDPDRRRSRNVGDFHGQRVLLLDENSTNCLILRETLASWCLESHSVGTVPEALAELAHARSRERPYSLVIFDDCLQGLSGAEIASSIKSAEPSVPLIVLSSGTSERAPARRSSDGIAGFAVKPVERADILRLVCDAMSGAKAGNPPSPHVIQSQDLGLPQEHLRILVAEDSADNRLLVHAYLKSGPYAVVFVEDGQAAVREFFAGSFDLVLMDVQMPGMDGLSAARTIRKREQELGIPRVPIVALTAHARHEDEEASKEAGCSFHLSKPISKRTLIDAIERFRRKEPSLPATPFPFPAEEIAHLIPAYLASKDEELRTMRTMLAGNDFEGIRVLSHNLKGTGASFGFAELSRMGCDLERSSREADATGARGLLEQLGEYLVRIKRDPSSPSHIIPCPSAVPRPRSTC